MKKTLFLASAALLFSVFALVSACKDKTEEGREVDCGKVTGATFSSNSGKMQAIVANKCGTSTCHAAGGDGSKHWTYSAERQPHTAPRPYVRRGNPRKRNAPRWRNAAHGGRTGFDSMLERVGFPEMTKSNGRFRQPQFSQKLIFHFLKIFQQ